MYQVDVKLVDWVYMAIYAQEHDALTQRWNLSPDTKGVGFWQERKLGVDHTHALGLGTS